MDGISEELELKIREIVREEVSRMLGQVGRDAFVGAVGPIMQHLSRNDPDWAARFRDKLKERVEQDKALPNSTRQETRLARLLGGRHKPPG